MRPEVKDNLGTHASGVLGSNLMENMAEVSRNV
jgi:hypothetical protein